MKALLPLALLLCLAADTAVAQVYSYDRMGRLTDVSYANGAGISYRYDANSNITRIEHRAPAANQPPDGQIDTPADDVEIEAGESVDFTATVGDADGPAPLTVRWDFDGAAPDSTDVDPGEITFDTAGSYTVRLNVVDGAGLADPTPASVVVTVTSPTPPAPPAPPTNPDSGSGGGGAGFALPLLLLLTCFRRLFPVVAACLLVTATHAANWAPMSSPTTADLADVWGTAPDNVFAVGAGGTILHFDGSNWTTMDSGVTADLTAVWGRSPTEIYAVGSGNTFLRYDGTDWTSEDMGVEPALFVDVWSAGPGLPLWVLATNRAWYLENGTWTPRSFNLGTSASLTPPAKFTSIGGTPDYIVVTSEDGGVNQDPGLFVNFREVASFDLSDIHAFSNTEMFAIGGTSRRLDGGDATNPNTANWQIINVTGHAVWGSSPDNVFALRRESTSTWILHYDGNAENSWERSYIQQFRILNELHGFGPTSAFAVGDAGTILRYSEAPPIATAANFPYAGMASPYVNAHTGELVLREADLDLGHVPPLRFERYYASGMQNDTRIGGSLGRNWTHNYEWRLLDDDDNGTARATVITSRGRVIVFEKPGTSWNLVSPRHTPYTLTETAAGIFFADPESERIYRFSSLDGRLETIQDRNGNTLYLNYTSGVLTGVEDRKGNELVLEYSNVNELAEVYTLGGSTSPESRPGVSFTYVDGNLATVTDGAGRVTTYSYVEGRETEALLERISLPLSSKLSWDWDEDRRVIAEHLAGGGTFTFGYDDAGSATTRETTVTNPDGGQRGYTHDRDGALVTYTDENGDAQVMEYDDDGRRVALTDRIGRRFLWTWDDVSGKVATERRPDDLGYIYTWEANGSAAGITFFDPVRVDNPDGTAFTFDYDGNGNVMMRMDQANNAWFYTRNAEGQVLTETNPLGGVTEYTYWSHGALQDIYDDARNRTSFYYDAYRWPTAIEHADGTRREFVLNLRGDVERITLETGHEIEIAYDADGRRQRVSESTGEQVSFAYDDRGLLQSLVQPHPDLPDTVTGFDYDDFGRATSIAYADGSVLNVGYDVLRRADRVDDGEGGEYSVERDGEGTLKVADLPGEGEIIADNSDNPLRRITLAANGDESVSVTHDAMGRVTTVTDANGDTLRLDRDERGYVSVITQPEDGVVTHVDRNALGKVTKVTDPAGGEWKREHDSQGRVTKTVDPLQKETIYAYNERNAVDRVEFPDGAGDLAIERDAGNRPTRKLYSDGTDIALDRDGKGRPTTGTGIELGYDTRGNLQQSNDLDIRYDELDRIRRITMAPGRWVEYAYDSRGNLQTVTDWMGGVTNIARNARGQADVITLPNAVQNDYGYDRAGRVVSIRYGEVGNSIGSIDLRRDWTGRVEEATRDLPGPQDFEAAERTFDFNIASQVERFEHDALGNVLLDDRRRYDFNLASQMTEYEGDGGAVRIAYDALNNRIGETTGAGAKAWTWNYSLGSGRAAVERVGGEDRWYYVYTTSGRLLYRIDPDGVRHHYHFDELGNTVFLTNDDGAIIATYFYSPLGEVLDESGSVDNDRKMAAEGGGVTTGNDLVYIGKNVHDTKSGRALSPKKSYPPKPAGLSNPYTVLRPNENPLAEIEREQAFTAKLRDVGFALISLTAEAGKQYLERYVPIGRVRSIGLAVFKGTDLGAGYAGVTATTMDTQDATPFKSRGARFIHVAGDGFVNSALALTPAGAGFVVGSTFLDGLSTLAFGDRLGFKDVLFDNVSEVPATLYEATIGGEGFSAIERMAKKIRTKQGFYGKYLTFLGEEVFGRILSVPVTLAQKNPFSADNRRIRYLEWCVANPGRCPPAHD